MPPSLTGRVAVVTGGNSGIGLEAARAFAAAGAHTVLACRNLTKAKAAAAELPGSAEALELDLAALASVHAFATTVAARFDRVDLLVNNAGIMAAPRRLTDDGFELHLGVNHLGHFALTGLLWPLLTSGAPGAAAVRVVTVSSGGHRRNALDFDDLGLEREYSRWTAYGRSKLANLLFAYELDRRAKRHGLDVVSVACHPGVARSNLTTTGPAVGGERPPWWLRLAYVAAQSAADGAKPTVFAALDPSVRGGECVGPTRLGQSRGRPGFVSTSPQSHDVEAAGRLWSESERLTGVRFLG